MSDLADALWQARLGGPVVDIPTSLTLSEAYAIAARNHARRLARGDRAAGRKIGHTWPATWAAQGIAAPTWGWLYADTTDDLADALDLAAWREPKVELELVLRLGMDRRPDAMALGLEIVDRPYPSWDFPVAASVSAGGVHAALLHGPWQPFDPQADLSTLRACLRVGEQYSEGGSERVLGSPLRALEALADLLDEQEALPLQPDEIVTTGALTPALPLKPGQRCEARIEGLPGSLLAPLAFTTSA
ncbi:2-keto-4-pentenoate hydratase [Inhella sp.]|uniref:2-keto-4-pentenoate hydratase n=1 Tax=Inhella sp. TaxID=1921806 RepID=UPI0035AE24F4